MTEDLPSGAGDIVLAGARQNAEDVAYSAGAGGIVISGLASGTDTDRDGLPDISDPRPADANGDADGDGWPDAWEGYLGTSATIANPPPAAGEMYVVVPYEGGPVTRDIPPDIPLAVRQADVYFLIDTSMTMDGEIANLQSSLVGTIVPGIQARIADVQFGVGEFRDYASSPPLPYRDDRTITSDILSVNAAIGALTNASAWPDMAESQTAALHSIATGANLDCGFGAAACPAGYVGHPCFRPGSLPIIVLVTDAEFHNGVWDTLDPPGPGFSSCYEYASCDAGDGACFPLSPACPSLETVVAELNAIDAKVIGVWSASWPGDLGAFSTWTSLPAYPNYDELIDLHYTVTGTGTLDGAGQPLLYGINSDGSGLGVEVVNAVDQLVDTMLIDVTADWEDPDPVTAPDTSVLVNDVDPVACSMCGGFDLPTNTALDVSPGSNVTFRVTFSNDTGEILPDLVARTYDVRVVVLGPGDTLLTERLVHVLVPGTLISVPTMDGHYWRTYDALSTCPVGQTPLWARLYPVTVEPTGTSVRFTVRTSATDLAIAVEHPLPTPLPDQTGDIQGTLLDLGESPNLRYLRVDAYLETTVPGVTPVLRELSLEHYCL